MKLLGMLDSPYVRRVAVAMRLLDIDFEHQPLSVFRDFERFRDINPLVKVPTLITDDGTVLVDSTLILEAAEEWAESGRSLMPAAEPQRLQCRRLTGVGLVAMEKAVSLYYECTQRPERLRHPGWIERHQLQLRSACSLLEQAADATNDWLFGPDPSLADITIAVGWTFIRKRAPDDVDAAAFPALTAYTDRVERNSAMRAFPFPAE